MPNSVNPINYTWQMLESEREMGSDYSEETLSKISDSVEEALSDHGMDIPDVDVIDHPDLGSGVQGSVTYNPSADLDGIIYIGSKAPNHPDSLAPRVSDTLAEEYMHIQFEEVDDFEVPTGMGVDILGSVWTLYSQGKIDDQEAVNELAWYSKHGYNNRPDREEGYGEMVEQGIHDLIEDFRDASEERKVMEYALQNPQKLFEKYNVDRL